MSIAAFEQRIKDYWKHTPAVVIVTEIKRRTELPKWEYCPKDHIYIGVSRRKNGDKITIVQKELEGVYNLTCKAEKLNNKDMCSMGLIPIKGVLMCRHLNEFCTRMSLGVQCNDCKGKEVK